MKKFITDIRVFCMLFITTVTMISCSSDNDIVEEQHPDEPQVYTMTVQASKGGNTRALSLDGSMLNATWTEGDAVDVWDSSRTIFYGQIYAISSGTSTTFQGVLDSAPTIGQSLLLEYLGSPLNFSNYYRYYYRQDGTLTGDQYSRSIDGRFDYAKATVMVNFVNTVETEWGSEIVFSTDAATFENQQAIVKFTLLQSDGSALPLNPTALTVSDGTNDVARLNDIPDATYTANGDGILYVAIPGISYKSVSLTATVGSDLYTYEKANVTFENSNYYAITVKMKKQCETLLSLKGKINASEDCSSYLGWEVNSDGVIAESDVIGTKIGYIGYISTNDVDNDISGSRILVLASSDASSSAAWATYLTSVSRNLHYDGMYGYSYTNKLQSYGYSAHPAASVAWNYHDPYVFGIPGGGATPEPGHWFLPHKSQLAAIISALGGYSTFKTKVGWSSSQYWSSQEVKYAWSDAYDKAWVLQEDGNWDDHHSKIGEYHVRACFAY